MLSNRPFDNENILLHAIAVRNSSIYLMLSNELNQLYMKFTLYYLTLLGTVIFNRCDLDSSWIWHAQWLQGHIEIYLMQWNDTFNYTPPPRIRLSLMDGLSWLIHMHHQIIPRHLGTSVWCITHWSPNEAECHETVLSLWQESNLLIRKMTFLYWNKHHKL